jgi:glycine/serine hydroxymethyltransferase
LVEVFKLPSPKENRDRVLQLLEEHHKWFSESIPLIASENVPSPAVREAIVSDFQNVHYCFPSAKRAYEYFQLR